MEVLKTCLPAGKFARPRTAGGIFDTRDFPKLNLYLSRQGVITAPSDF
jgi:hypothetical protein